MGNQRNVDNLRRGYAAFAQGDMDVLKELFSPDIVWHVPGNSPLSGDYKGFDEVAGFFGRIAQETQGNFKLEVHDVLANDEHGVALVKSSGKRGDKTLESNQAHVFHMDAEGHVTEYWGFPDDQVAADDFWS